jgi:hypothetical protein
MRKKVRQHNGRKGFRGNRGANRRKYKPQKQTA